MCGGNLVYDAYHVTCSCGRAYIGETKIASSPGHTPGGCGLGTRLRQREPLTCIKEHKAATRRGELEKSAIAEPPPPSALV